MSCSGWRRSIARSAGPESATLAISRSGSCSRRPSDTAYRSSGGNSGNSRLDLPGPHRPRANFRRQLPSLAPCIWRPTAAGCDRAHVLFRRHVEARDIVVDKEDVDRLPPSRFLHHVCSDPANLLLQTAQLQVARAHRNHRGLAVAQQLLESVDVAISAWHSTRGRPARAVSCLHVTSAPLHWAHAAHLRRRLPARSVRPACSGSASGCAQ